MINAMAARNWRSRLGSWVTNIVTIVLAVSWAIPLVWALVASLRPADEPIGRGDVWFGSTLTLDNYVRAWSLAPFNLYYVNTIVIVMWVLGIQMITITLAAFAFAHYHFRGEKGSVLLYPVADDDSNRGSAGSEFLHHSHVGAV